MEKDFCWLSLYPGRWRAQGCGLPEVAVYRGLTLARLPLSTCPLSALLRRKRRGLLDPGSTYLHIRHGGTSRRLRPAQATEFRAILSNLSRGPWVPIPVTSLWDFRDVNTLFLKTGVMSSPDSQCRGPTKAEVRNCFRETHAAQSPQA